MNNKKRLNILIFGSCIVILIAAYIQFTGQSKINASCSYLDPITIDIMAFLAALFLVIDGISDLFSAKNLDAKIWRIYTRTFFGVAIVTLHIIQFIHK
ncbi:hypothetical protein AUK11_03550 [bacterium CG2_30_37_16]|nr:MAG: hypothetical protein AUK11_03550 [bacterium CG2_30_37_16]PIP30861.1 MAG: hypothetical protein COX25_02490 [bacterium (Candidatus Howlettbacteria) CG23_combo_of_CG06-09_8_20_14_all_37_9]PIX99034.1 MAG: hypothetical protein COZ22_03590 [bacterium (Candidatus Howlettbacteria) CG_4_10_14_3_um_filter_37_10]PJB06073.1 MAG: hypothetical protein CO123_02835 [bacterium (Candidatus Howlettbacteria) CG_4_9_14_3_um_filter_37_10]